MANQRLRLIVRMSALGVAVATAAGLGACSSSPGEEETGVCGNGRQEAGERCDGADLGGATCVSIGFGAGSLGCAPTCADLDRSGCGAPATCGNGQIDGPELCDGAALGTATCESLGFGAGPLRCLANCGGYDTSGCAAPPTCGNGRIDPGVEVCDGTLLGGKTCGDFDHGSGTLACAADCRAFEFGGCFEPCVPQCGARVCGVDPVCGQPCGTCTDPTTRCNDTTGQCDTFCDLTALTQSGAHDFDLETVSVSGTVTLNGAPLPDDAAATARGSLVFRRVDTGDELWVNLPKTGAATYQVTLYAGAYAVDFDSDYYSTTVLPRQRIRLERVELTAATTKDFALRTVALSGAVTLNGAQVPDDAAASARGSLVFRRADTGDELWVNLPKAGAASYQTTLYAGAYVVRFDSDYYSTSVLPRQIIVLEALELAAATTRSFDLKTVALSGQVTLNGGQMPDDAAASARGSLILRRADTRDELWVNLPKTGAASYQTTLYAGSYAVLFDSDYYSTTALPRQTIALGPLDLVATTTRSFDLKTFVVSGQVTLNGAVMPDDAAASARGSLIFRRADTGDELWANLPKAGAASYQTTLYAGPYAVGFDSDYYSTTVLPRQTIALDVIEVTAATTRTFDLKTVEVSGQVTRDGAVMPDDAAATARGSLIWRRLDTGDELWANLPKAGAATYQTTLFAGPYTVGFDSDYYSTTVLPRQEIVLARGCPVVDASCTASADDLSGSWLVDFPSWMYGTMLLEITQSGTSLSGSFDFVGLDSGDLTGAVSSSGTVHLDALGASYPTVLDGTVLGGCLFSGRAECNGQLSDFIARRLQ